MPKNHRKNRIIEREGVNATCAFFESHGCIFQEISLGNDYGKDAMVDFGNDSEVTSICAALQIKSGVSYRNGNDYYIPLRNSDREYWASSTVPVLGLVYDPTDRTIRWVNISTYLSRCVSFPKSIPVPHQNILDSKSLRSEVYESVKNSFSSVHMHPLVQLCDESSEVQERAVRDCFILGRSDSRILIGLRRMIFQTPRTVLGIGIMVLTHLTSHPDIFWTNQNWIPYSVRDGVRPYLIWTVAEIVQLMNYADPEEWRRGGLGQHIYMLLIQDPDLDAKLVESIIIFLSGDRNVAIFVVQILVSLAGENGAACLQNILSTYPELEDDPLIRETRAILSDFGSIEIW